MIPDNFELGVYRLASGKLAAFTPYGSYPLFYVTHRDDVLCAGCADNRPDEIRVAGANWESVTLSCDECGAEIESAYGEPGERSA